MFLDTVVLAGIGTVALMVAFFGGVGLFIWKDSHKKGKAIPGIMGLIGIALFGSVPAGYTDFDLDH